MIKLLVGTLLALAAANVLAGNMYIYKDKDGQVVLINVNPSGNFDKLTKKVKVTNYRESLHSDSKASKSNQKQTDLQEPSVSYGTSSNFDSASYSNSAYLALR